jgi:hypothetical protein
MGKFGPPGRFRGDLVHAKLPHRRQLVRNPSNGHAMGVEDRSVEIIWRKQMLLSRSHPVLSAFALGAMIGGAVATILMFTVGHVNVVMNRFLLILWPTVFLGAWCSSLTMVVVVEIVGNALLYALLFTISLGLAAAIRHFRRHSSE